MWVLPDPWDWAAEALRERWIRDGTELVAPPLFRSEVTSSIRLWVHRAALSPNEGRRRLERAFLWPVVIYPDGDDLQRSAFELATRHSHPRAYDAQYLALALLLGCELWTGDQRLVQSVSDKLSWVRWVGDYQPA